MKKLLHAGDESVARMQREIDVARQLGHHRRIMPVLDASDKAEWFVMPLATASAEARQDRLGSDDHYLRKLVTGIGAALTAAHERGWVHRDVKPANILLLDKRWVLADWGLGRRPRGSTTLAGRTQTGRFLGTEGFAAPEQADDAHSVGPAADVYGVGQVIGWAVTGRLPLPYAPLVPDSGPWRSIVREATHRDPRQRPQSISELLELINTELDDPPASPANQAAELLEQLRGGDNGAGVKLWRLAARTTDDYDLYIEVLAKMPDPHIHDLSASEPARALAIAKAMGRHVEDSSSIDFGDASRVVRFLLRIARTAAREENWDLLEAAAEAMFAWDGTWDQWDAQDAVRPWLSQLSGEAARIVGGRLRRQPASAEHFSNLGENRRVHPRIAAAVAVQGDPHR